VPLRTVPQLLTTLVEARRWAPELPAVTLLLASGKGVTGEVLRYDDAVTVVAEADALVTVSSAAILGVRVHGAADAVEVLSGGTVELKAADEAPTVAHLRRDVAALESRWADELPGELSLSLDATIDTEARRLSLQRLLVDLEAAVAAIGAPFVHAVDRIVISQGPAPGAERVERDLWLSVDLDHGRIGRWEDSGALAESLRSAMR